MQASSKSQSNSSGTSNALWFFVALSVGGLCIWLAKSSFTNPWIPALTAASFVLILMFYYVFNKEDAREEQGDNIYYLGLLFTLLSLIFALVEIFGAKSVITTSVQVRELLENFGIALTSTVVGILGRIVVQNWQSSLPAWFPFRTSFVQSVSTSAYRDQAPTTEDLAPPSDNASFAELQDFYRHILGRTAIDLTQGANALARFHRIVRSHASATEKYLDDHSQKLKDDGIAFSTSLHENVDLFVAKLNEAAKETLDTLVSRHNRLLTVAEELQEKTSVSAARLIRDTETKLDSFQNAIQRSSDQTLEGIKVNSDALGDQFRSISNVLAPTLAQISAEITLFADRLQGITELCLSVGDGWKTASEQNARASVEIEKFNREIELARGGITSLIEILDSMKAISEKMQTRSDLEDSAKAVRDIGESMRLLVAESVSANDRAKDATGVFEEFRDIVEVTRAEVGKNLESLQDLSAAARHQIEILGTEKPSGSWFSRVFHKKRK